MLHVAVYILGQLSIHLVHLLTSMNLEDIIILSLNDSSVELLHHIVHILIQKKVKGSVGICIVQRGIRNND